jgi:spoIIIJ-associated protein
MNTQALQETILALLDTAGFSRSAVTVTFDESMQTLWFSIASNDARVLLGRGAEALGALNHLASKVAEKLAGDTPNPIRVIIDANDFEKKKIENLKTIAHMMAERARYFKSRIEVEPMPPRDRKIIHEFLSAMPDISTESEGMGPKRHIVIKYIGTAL